MAVTVERESGTQPVNAPAAAARRPLTTHDSRLASRTVALFLAFLGFYLLTASGHLYAVDEETLFRATESAVERGTLALPADAWGLVTSEQRVVGRSIRNISRGNRSRRFRSISWVKQLRRSSRVRHTDSASLRSLALWRVRHGNDRGTAYRLGLALGYRERTALVGAAVYGLATTAWPYARTFYAEPLTALCLLAAFHAIRRGTERAGAHGWLAWGGVVAGLALREAPRGAGAAVPGALPAGSGRRCAALVGRHAAATAVPGTGVGAGDDRRVPAAADRQRDRVRGAAADGL